MITASKEKSFPHMITVSEALEIIKKNSPKKTCTLLSLDDAAMKVLASDILAPEPSPRYTNSAMDGFALRWDDIKDKLEKNNEASAVLKLLAESHAGLPFDGLVASGETARISTGAMIPNGADTVVPLEDVLEKDGEITILSAKKKEQHVRFAGEEIKEGDKVLEAGAILSPDKIALLASLGVFEVPVFHEPKLSVILTGSELAPYNIAKDLIKPWQIRDSNSIMLRQCVKAAGSKLTEELRVGDSLEETVAALKKAEAISDIVIFSGGVSVGSRDFVKDAAEQLGFETLFWRIKQKPGKPLFFAKKKDTLLFGLPGNPVSSYICFMHYIYPLIRELASKDPALDLVKGKLVEAVNNKGPRENFIRVYFDKKDKKVYPIQRQGSHMLSSATQANAYVLVEPCTSYAEGDEVKLRLFPWSDFS